MRRLENKSALITGGAAGIGAACAQLFCAEGASVTVVDADGQGLKHTVQSVQAKVPNARITSFKADVSVVELAEAAVRHAVSQYGSLNILINNAAMRNYSSLAEATPEEWLEVVKVNLIGCASYCRAALPYLRQAGNSSIVNVSSCYAVNGRKGMGIYDSTKSGQLALSRTLAHEEAQYGVRANVVCPGSTLTNFHASKAMAVGKSIDQLKSERSDTSLLSRWASPEEVAWPILWLASDEASFITGATLMVDGGLSAM